MKYLLQHLKNQLGLHANYYFDFSHATINVDSNNINLRESNLVKPSSKSAYEGWRQSIDWIGIVNIIIYAVLAALQTHTAIVKILLTIILKC